MIILGLDPGSVRAGYGIIKKTGGKLIHLESGLLLIPKESPHKLAALEESLEKLLKKYKPERAGIEKLFFVNNQKTALEVAQSRGVLVNAINKKSIPLIELTPSEIKKSVTGDGKANKRAVAKMVNMILGSSIKALDDTTDALATAIAVSTMLIP